MQKTAYTAEASFGKTPAQKSKIFEKPLARYAPMGVYYLIVTRRRGSLHDAAREPKAAPCKTPIGRQPESRRGPWRGQKRPTCRYNLSSSILTANRGKTAQKSALFPIVAKASPCYNYRWSGSFRPTIFSFSPAPAVKGSRRRSKKSGRQPGGEPPRSTAKLLKGASKECRSPIPSRIC